MRTILSDYKICDRKDVFRVILVACIDKVNSIGDLNVFKMSCVSLLDSIKYPTSVTIIDNGSDSETKEFLNQLVTSGKIQRLVTNQSNLGKLNPLVSEFYATDEELVTFSDCDVFFHPDWQIETVKLFKNVCGVGYVGLIPLPSISIENTSTFWWSALFHGFSVIKESNIFNVNLDVFQESIWGHSEMTEKSREYIVADQNGLKFIPGGGHVVGTYYRPSINGLLDFVPVGEWRGAEYKYLDPLCDKNGYMRISTYGFKAMHLGNSITNRELALIQEVRKIDFSNMENIPYSFSKRIKFVSFLGRYFNGYRVSKVLRNLLIGD